ncbi:MAG: DUF5305 domain-containing protein [Halovenus sp.]
MDVQRWIRVRIILDEYLSILVAVCLVLALAGGYLAFTAYGETQTATETEQTASWESRAGFTHSATVVNSTAVYERGQTLEGRTSYFREITPRLNGSFGYTYTATDGGDLRANTSVFLVLRSVTEDSQGNVTEYWRLDSPLTSREATLSPGETVQASFSTNVSRVAQRLDAIDEQVGTTPGQKELLFEARLDLSGTRNGRPVDETKTYRMPVSLSGNVYEVQDPGAVTDSGQQTEQVTVTVEPGPISAYGGPLLLLVGLVGAGGLGGARYRGDLAVSDRERDWLQYQNTREEFDEWITVVGVPSEDWPDSAITVDSLEGLVDVAIDTDRRVLEDRERDRFVVFEGDRTYTYSPPDAPEDDRLPPADGQGDLGGGSPEEEAETEGG